MFPKLKRAWETLNSGNTGRSRTRVQTSRWSARCGASSSRVRGVRSSSASGRSSSFRRRALNMDDFGRRRRDFRYCAISAYRYTLLRNVRESWAKIINRHSDDQNRIRKKYSFINWRLFQMLLQAFTRNDHIFIWPRSYFFSAILFSIYLCAMNMHLVETMIFSGSSVSCSNFFPTVTSKRWAFKSKK